MIAEYDDSIAEDTFKEFALKNYLNSHSRSEEEFEDDILRFKYVKRLLNRYSTTGHIKDLKERLIINHIIILFNVFSKSFTHSMLNHRLDQKQQEILKPFLLFLGHINEYDMIGIESNPNVVNKLRTIRRSQE